MRKRLARYAGFVALALAAGVFPRVPYAGAQQALQLVTPYPAVSVQAGKSVTLNLEVITPTRRRVDLQVVETPPGWNAVLRGGGFVIHGVFGSPKDADTTPPQVQLEVQVPTDVAQGDYRVLVRGTAAGATDVLTVDVRVSEAAAGAVTLSPEFPSLRGSSTDTFPFSITLTNNSPDETTFSLAAEGPEGWRVEARPTAEARAATVSVEGGGTANIQVEADPPDETIAGAYPIKVRASGEGHSAETDVSVEITGNVAMVLTTETERLNTSARAGRATRVGLVIRNEGTAPLASVSLSATPPGGWEVNFDREEVAGIEPGQTANVSADIIPAGEAVAGDYSVQINASGEGSTESIEMRVTVETSPLWGFFGILLIAGAVGGLFWVFRRYGRR